MKHLAIPSLLIVYTIAATTPCGAFAGGGDEPQAHSHRAAAGDPVNDGDSSSELRQPCACGCGTPQSPGDATQRLPVGLLTRVPTPLVFEGDTVSWVQPARRVEEIVDPLDPVPI